MEPWVPLWPSQSWGRPMAPPKDPDRGLRSGYHRPVPHPWHNGERFHQWQDIHGSPQPLQDPRADHLQPPYAPRSGEWRQPASGVDYYDGAYPSQGYSRPGYEDPYQRYHSPTMREEHAYGNYYYHGHSQRLQEEGVPRQGSPYIWHEDYGDQKYPNDHPRENQNSPFGMNSETQFQSTSWTPYNDSPASSSGQERPGELFSESQLTGARKNKPSWTSKSNLVQQHESGLSSSSYELSQYMADAPEQYDPTASAAWSQGDVPAAAPKAPMKFYIPHVSVSFGPGGQLVCVCPNSPADGQTALVVLHSMEVILNDSEDQEEMRSFSGPLIREDVHKVDIMTFCQQKAAQSLKSETPGSRDSALLWQLLVLLCRQNGSMVGSDIAELLMQDCKKLEKYKRQPPVADLISLTDEDWPRPSSGARNLLTGEVPPTVETPAQIVEKFTKLLYYGRKKEALEWAMKNHLWGHALFLSSKMDPRTYNWVMSGFTSTLALNDPLQTLFQLMSGRIPQAATCCGDKQWGDWRPHLAVILSNQAGDPELHQRAIVTMGDTLAGKGLVAAAHFCYLMAHEPFGHYTVKTDHLALLGSSHSQEFLRFATTEAIQRTEVFEYCQMLGRPKAFIPSFQVYKLLYASRLADYGLASQALHYCEAIGAAVLSQGGSSPPVLLAELIKLAEKLKLSDPLALERRRGDRDLEPDWLQQLRRRQRELEQKMAGDIGDPPSARSDTSGARGRTTDTSSQDLPGRQGHSEAPGHHSAPWPEQAGPPQPSPQPPFPPQWGPLPVGGGTGHMQAPVPLYSVPETHLPGPSGDSVCDSVAVTGAPGGRAWEETLQTQPTSGASAASQDTAQHPGGPQDISKPQVPLALRARNFSESSTILGQEDEESSDEADKKSSPNAAQREKPGDVKEGTKGSGFGWFSWFRSKPTSNVSPSGEEDSGDSTDSEQEPPRASSPPEGLPPMPLLESPPLPGAGASSRGTGGGDLGRSSPSGGTAEGAGIGGFSGCEGVSSEVYSTPGVLPPPALKGAVPLYNPSQVPQLPVATSLNRPSRLAQRRYPTQPC
ncbi:protein transport protein Sec16B isoform X1 [Sciurus carolinensis]|uniref:protein transport protein Sec16B isoform X1 n=1 Tax=Sciurus carolinensis TaxID=30640 RepID=UPI001FB28841|nr:protein transport protein Sec16B isoform X1 [Sciurus carolinensis]XP_047377684.1 protein transport protein Sec16B isoform X1 [Sciurus carolinensis]XP_047377685.1 protein transport protein Sec16B isoform X1 [Sciurus carolinensis]XP_047377686.1 protein transport protein Sec16B isoform X1 [Sciurus carolinensis]